MAVMVPCVMVGVHIFGPNVDYSTGGTGDSWQAPPLPPPMLLPASPNFCYDGVTCWADEEDTTNVVEAETLTGKADRSNGSRSARLSRKELEACEQSDSNEDESDCSALLAALQAGGEARSLALLELQRPGRALSLALTKDGSHVVRTALQVAPIDEGLVLTAALLKHVVELAQSKSGVHVLAFQAKSLNGDSAVSVLQQLQPVMHELARRRIGAQLLERLLRTASKDMVLVADTVSPLHADLGSLIVHSQGWQLALAMLQSVPAVSAPVAQHLISEASSYSMHPVAGALVMELLKQEAWASDIAESILDSERPGLMQVASTAHGSDIVIRLLELGAGGDELEIRLVQRAKALSRSSYGRRVAACLRA